MVIVRLARLKTGGGSQCASASTLFSAIRTAATIIFGSSTSPALMRARRSTRPGLPYNCNGNRFAIDTDVPFLNEPFLQGRRRSVLRLTEWSPGLDAEERSGIDPWKEKRWRAMS